METNPPASLDPWFSRLFGDDEPSGVGSGWPGGVVAVLAGVLAVGGVLCLRFPATLTAPSLRVIYPLRAVRVAIGALVALAFALGTASALVRRRKVLGATAAGLATLALALGGPTAAVPATIGRGAGIGLDWFLLNALLMTAIFVPLERLAPRDPDQRVFRRGWSTDAIYVLVGHASIQVVSAVVVLPGLVLRERVFGAAAPTLGRLPLWSQLPMVLVVADLAFYWLHRAAHHFPWFWRLHRLHHSSERMDWLASERLHLAEIVLVRSLVLIPLTLLGFSQAAVLSYVTFASFHAVFIHANFRPSLRWLEPLLMTPRLHHLHHATDADAIDKNFAVHLPILDRLFGTFFAPAGRWAAQTGVVDFQTPEGYWGQQASVFARRKRAAASVKTLVALTAATSLAGCTVAGAEVRSVASLGPEVAVVHECPKAPKITYWPASAGAICFSVYGGEVEVQAHNARSTATGIGPLVPILWFVPAPADASLVDAPLVIDVLLKMRQPFTFDPWRVSLRTAQGESIGVTRVGINLHGHSVDVAPRTPPLLANSQYFLTFERHLPPEQEFALAIHLTGPDGADVPLPAIRFRAGKVRFLGTVP